MPEAPAKDSTDDSVDSAGGLFTGYGIASAVLGAIAVAAVALAAMIWTGHRSEVAERDYQTRVLQTAADWTNILINLNTDTVESGVQKLHEGTVGQLNTDFDATVQPFRDLVKRLQSNSTGQIDSVSIESIYHPPPRSDVAGGPAPGPNVAGGPAPGPNVAGGPAPGPNGAPQQPPQPELTGLVSRIDHVLVVATSVSQNAGSDKPQTVRWTLRLDVSDVDGQLMISRLEPIR